MIFLLFSLHRQNFFAHSSSPRLILGLLLPFWHRKSSIWCSVRILSFEFCLFDLLRGFSILNEFWYLEFFFTCDWQMFIVVNDFSLFFFGCLQYFRFICLSPFCIDLVGGCNSTSFGYIGCHSLSRTEVLIVLCGLVSGFDSCLRWFVMRIHSFGPCFRDISIIGFDGLWDNLVTYWFFI